MTDEIQYYSDDEPHCALEEVQEQPALSPDQIRAVGRRLRPPTSDELVSVDSRRSKAIEVAANLGCDSLVYLMEEGHPSLTEGALKTLYERDQGQVFHYEAGVLYRYAPEKGRYEPATEDFEREVASITHLLAEETRRVQLAASVWPAEVAGLVLRTLPRVQTAEAVIRRCRNSLYRTWQNPLQSMNRDKWVLNVRNGLLDLRTFELRPHTEAHLSSVQVPFDYDPKAKCHAWMGYIKSALPELDHRRVLAEAFGYCLLPTTYLEVAFFLVGSGGTGKSTAVKTLRKLVGTENCSAVALEDLSDKFRAGMLRDKLVNVVTEVNPAKAVNDARFKAYVSGDPVTAEAKFKDPSVVQPFARFVVAANTLPKVVDWSDAFYRRCIVFEFNQRFVSIPDPAADPPEMPRDPDLGAKLEAEMSGILAWALRGLQRLIERGRFDIPESLHRNVMAFREEQDNGVRFLHDECVFSAELEVTTGDLYRAYEAWCRVNREKPHPVNVFGRIVSSHKGVTAAKNGSRGRYYRGLRPADAHIRGGT